ncbi:Acetyltransferase (GNAT) family protein [Poriferisphaera corsica]|uniref:Acetyltransferase (GNAT) family protein n=1 Tax=Poriferisphaera corsica TaxID=2528020 RepID=A0A517YYL2_9BACT|nr:GNAT family N-acetyltransferase [Poriferisphaera corsica]QDU35316.1 Acetyltransferase (GNAT) family protein [Poriferisphaera corsica]
MFVRNEKGDVRVLGGRGGDVWGDEGDGGGDCGGGDGENGGDGSGKMWVEVVSERVMEGCEEGKVFGCEAFIEGVSVSVGKLCLRVVCGDEEVIVKAGGHLGYEVWESYQGRGYGTRMVGLALRVLSNYGIDRVLVVTGEHNEASKRVLEKVGGEWVGIADEVGCEGDSGGGRGEDGGELMGVWVIE